MSYNAFDIILKCKEYAEKIDLANVILDNTSIDEKEILIKLIEGMRTIELEIIEYEPISQPEAQA